MKVLFICTLIFSTCIWATDDVKLRATLEKEVEKLEPDVIRLRNLDQLKKKRDELRNEKETLMSNIGNETSSQIIREIDTLKTEVAKLKPISELATKKRQLAQEKKALIENIYSNNK